MSASTKLRKRQKLAKVGGEASARRESRDAHGEAERERGETGWFNVMRTFGDGVARDRDLLPLGPALALHGNLDAFEGRILASNLGDELVRDAGDVVERTKDAHRWYRWPSPS